MIRDLTILTLVLLNVWQHRHHESAVDRWRKERGR